MEWARSSAGKESDLGHLLEFLQSELQRRERSQTFATMTAPDKERSSFKPSKRGGSATALVSHQSTAVGPQCSLCGKKGHETVSCYGWKPLGFDQRLQKVKDLGLCFRCLKGNCQAWKCTSQKFCPNRDCKQGKHHILLCKKKLTPPSQADEVPALLSAKPSQIIMQIAKINVYDSKLHKYVSANVFFDTGSNKSYVSRDFVKKLNLVHEGFDHVSYVAFGSTETFPCVMRNIQCNPLISTFYISTCFQTPEFFLHYLY